MAFLDNGSMAKLCPRVEMQIKRAKQQLVTSPENHPAVQATLDTGRVKPIFHALSLPETFLNNRRSSHAVTAGAVDQRREMEFDFDGENLDEVVDASGIGAASIIDRGVDSPWMFSHKLANFAVELVNTDAEMLGEDVECTKLTSIPTGINIGNTSDVLLTRRESRGVVSNVFHGFAREDRGSESVAAITGSEGVGKSWTLVYALQQALLYDGATVLFFHQKCHRAVMYLRRNNVMYAWMTRSETDAHSMLFGREDILVIVDPREPKERTRLFVSGCMKLLYAAINNDEHKSSSATQAYLGPPLDDEMNVILKHLDPSLKQNIIKKRSKHVGNLVRYVLKADQYSLRLKSVNRQIVACEDDPALLETALLASGMSKGRDTIPGTLFELLPARPRDLTAIGYDGQGIKYCKRVVQTANGQVLDAILRGGRRTILTYWEIASGDEYTRMKKEAEKIFIEDLTNPQGIVMIRHCRGKTSGWDENELVVQSGNLVQSGVTTSETRAAVLAEPNVVAEIATGSEMINAAGPGRKMFHVTSTTSHVMSLAAMERICKIAGLIDDGGNVAPTTAVGKLELYWVVSSWLCGWKDKFPYKCPESEDQELWNRINQCLEVHVKQYVLPMTNRKPITFSERESGENPQRW